MKEFTYIVIDSLEELSVNIDELLEHCAEPMRRSDDGVHTYIKYVQPRPEFINSLSTKSTEYNREQMVNMYFVNENWENRHYF